MRKFELKLYERIIEQLYDIEVYADDGEFTPYIRPSGFYYKVKNFTISKSPNNKLSTDCNTETILSQKFEFTKADLKRNKSKILEQKKFFYTQSVKAMEKLNREEFELGKEKLFKWRNRINIFPNADEPIQKVKYIENYLYASLEWFEQNNLTPPDFMLDVKKTDRKYFINWNGTEEQLNKLFDEMKTRKYFIDSMQFSDFQSHFIIDDKVSAVSNPTKLNFIDDKVILVNLLQSLCSKFIIEKRKKWVKFSKHFLWQGKELKNKDFNSQLGKHTSIHDLEFNKLLKTLSI